MAEHVILEDGWRQALQDEFDSAYMAELKTFLLNEKTAGKKIFPTGSAWFRALNLTPNTAVRVVILGQDPVQLLHPRQQTVLISDIERHRFQPFQIADILIRHGQGRIG